MCSKTSPETNDQRETERNEQRSKLCFHCQQQAQTKNPCNKIVKLVCLFFAITNVTVQASPTATQKRQSPHAHVFTENSIDRMESTSIKSRRSNEYDNLNVFVKRLLSRRSRSARSSCEPSLKRLFDLALHAFTQAKSTQHRGRMRRGRVLTLLLNHGRSWGERWKIAHDRLQQLYCDTLFYPDLFEKETPKLKSAINSVLIVLQQELNKHEIVFSEVSKSFCRAQYSDRQNKPISLVQKSFLQELFSLGRELETVCENLDL